MDRDRLKLVEAIPDHRIRRLIAQRTDQLATSPKQQGRPLIGELAGFRSVRAVGQRYRVVYRVEREEVVVLIVAVGRRRSGDKSGVYELARKLLRQRLLRLTSARSLGVDCPRVTCFTSAAERRAATGLNLREHCS